MLPYVGDYKSWDLGDEHSGQLIRERKGLKKLTALQIKLALLVLLIHVCFCLLTPMITSILFSLKI